MKSYVLAGLLLGCASASSLPDYAAPKGQVVAADKLEAGDLVSYRRLSRADFRGTHAPKEFAQVADRVGAATCGQVRTTPDTQLLLKWRQETPTSPRQHWLEIKKLGFMALMDRRCSWWNAPMASRKPAYVLEHEQVHFALYELGARKLNASTESIRRAMTSSGTSSEAVESHAQQALNRVLAEATVALLERNRDFDQDTSLGFRPDRQREWLRRVREELAATLPYASPPYPPPG